MTSRVNSKESLLYPRTLRLSVIIAIPGSLLDLSSQIQLPGLPKNPFKALAERAVQSVLSQPDPIGVEVVVVSGSQDAEITDHLEAIFGVEKTLGRLQIHQLERIGDLGRLRNEGVARSQGTYLAFLDLGDAWRTGRLAELDPLLYKKDLILGADESHFLESADWVRAFLNGNWGLTSTAVIRRTLFDEIGGFPEGYSGIFLPKRLPGIEDYEFWMKCVIRLVKQEKRDRFLLIPNRMVEVDPSKLHPPTTFLQKAQQFKELISLLHIAPKLPPRYWPTLAKRVAERGRELLPKKKPRSLSET